MITVTAPPYVLCRDRGLTDSNNCSLNIETVQPSVTDELKCPRDMVMEQVTSQLVKMGDKIPVCEAMVTNENWKEAKYTLKLKATIDNKYDGDHKREFNINMDYIVNGMVEQANISKKALKV